MRKCCSQNRCGRLDCGNCSWRAAGPVARRIMANDPRHLHAVSIEVPISSLADFWLWRVQARNVVDYRRASRWWSELTLCVWLRHDNRLCGILSLGAITPGEFEAAVGRRWPMTLRAIDPTKVREEIYAVIRPGMIADCGLTRGWYQPVKFAVWPKRQRMEPRLFDQSTFSPRHAIEPMPVLF
jgi:hypothetical protein